MVTRFCIACKSAVISLKRMGNEPSSYELYNRISKSDDAEGI